MKKRTIALILGMSVFAIAFGGCSTNKATETANKSEAAEKEGNGEDQETQEAEKKAKEEAKKKENEDKAIEPQEPEEKKSVSVLLPKEAEPWSGDEETLVSLLEDKGYEATVLYAEGDGETQAAQVQEQVEAGTDGMILAPADPYALTEALALAKENKIPVFSYDELIMDSDAVSYYVTFNSRETGQALGNNIVEKMGLEKAREEKRSYNIEFFMGSLDDIKSLFLYNGVMEVLKPYLDDGTLVCQSGRTAFDDTGILRFSQNQADMRCREILGEFYQGKTLDIVCTAFDTAVYGVWDALESVGIQPGSSHWPYITGVGCETQAVKGIAEGRMACSMFMDRSDLGEACVKMVDTYLKGEKPEVTDYEQYDNGKKIIGTYTLKAQLIDKDNYELLIDKGYYTAEEVQPEVTPVPGTASEEGPAPTAGEQALTPTPEGAEATSAPGEEDASRVSPAPTKKPGVSVKTEKL